VRNILPVLCIILTSAFVVCEPPEIVQSTWTDADSLLAVDPGRWKTLVHYPDDPQFGIAAENDERFLYLCMTSWKREINKRILRHGFTTWFSSKSKKGKRFGIHFPMGAPDNAMPSGRLRHGASRPEASRPATMETFQEMEFLGPGKNDSVPVKVAVAESFGIVVRLFPTDESLVYLLKVPFNSDSVSKYAMDIGKDTLINVTFETFVPEAPPDNDGEGGQPSAPAVASSGMGTSGGEHGGGMHGSGPTGHGAAPEFIEPFSAGFSVGIAKLRGK
jgi:hypothetical protein